MNKKTIPTALIGAAAAVSLLAGCSGTDEDPTPKNAASMSQAFEQGLSAAEAAKERAQSQAQSPASAFDPLVTTGEKFQYTQTSTAVIDEVSKVSDPAPGCAGEYFAATITVTNDKPNHKAAPTQGRLTPYNEQKQNNHTAQDNQLQPGVSPLYCESEAPWPTALVMPGASTTAKVYARAEGVTDPVVLELEANTGLGVYIEIPESLR